MPVVNWKCEAIILISFSLKQCLQTLVKEQETKLVAMKIEKELEKSSLKDSEKTLASYEKEQEAFLKDIKCLTDVVIGKSKWNIFNLHNLLMIFT